MNTKKMLLDYEKVLEEFIWEERKKCQMGSGDDMWYEQHIIDYVNKQRKFWIEFMKFIEKKFATIAAQEINALKQELETEKSMFEQNQNELAEKWKKRIEKVREEEEEKWKKETKKIIGLNKKQEKSRMILSKNIDKISNMYLQARKQVAKEIFKDTEKVIIIEYFGKKCKDYEKLCIICEVWRDWEKLKSRYCKEAKK